MAYDIESDRIILFGGLTGDYSKDPAYYNGETWAYDVTANRWTQMKPPSGPTRRCAAELAYDAESDRVILYGGCNEVTWGLGDTWAYDFNTNTWTQMAFGPDGPTHIGARLAYDAESDRIILFGGCDMGGSLYNDTWAYDFNSDTWTEMKPRTSPPGRNYQAMAYNAKSDRVLVWGVGDVTVAQPDESVWSYDFNTNTWQEMKPGAGPHPSDRAYATWVYDAAADRMILFGGFVNGTDETWAYDYNTNTWTKLEPSTVPGKRSRHALVYSTAADRAILFGGQVGYTQFQYTGETWIYDLSTNTWTNVTPPPTGTPEPTQPSFKNILVYDPPEMYQVHVETVQYRTLSEPSDTLDLDVFYPPDRQVGKLLPAVILANDFPQTAKPPISEWGSRTFGVFQSWGRLIAASGLIAVAYDTIHPNDIEAVVRHIQQHSADLGIDADRLGLWSASSHVAVASSFAYQENRDYLKFAVFYYGPIFTPDNFRRQDFDASCVPLGCYGAELPSAKLLRTDLPVFVVRAGKDTPLNQEPIDHFAQLAKEAGVPLTLIRFDEGSHIFDWSNTSFGEVKVKAVEIVKQTLEFMKANALGQ
jgi:hypothetical protein